MVLVALTAALAAVQFASDSLYADAAAPHTLPHRIPAAFGDAVYRAIDALAPAPYAESTLASRALGCGDLAAAARYALALPASSTKDALLARIADANGDHRLALEYELAAFDTDAVDASAQRLAARDPQAAYALERLLALELSRRAGHPDAEAQARWQMGLFANRVAWRQVPGSVAQRAWLRTAREGFDAAAQLAPLSERYAIADANQADLLGDRAAAERSFRRAAQIDPASADAIAGLGVVAYQNGDRAGAQAYLAKARALDPQSLMVRALERDLR